MIEVSLSTTNDSLEISKDYFQVVANDKIKFTAEGSNFFVRFPKADFLFKDWEKSEWSEFVTAGDLNGKETPEFKEPIFDDCIYYLEIQKSIVKAPAKMTVKAIITRNG
jgi:hypothetical protein